MSGKRDLSPTVGALSISFTMTSALAFALAFVAMLHGNGHGGVHGHPNPSEDTYQKAFVDFARRFEKHYDVSEFFSRYNAFKTSFDFIEQHNAANFSYTVGINEFMDLTNDEFIATHTGYKRLSGARRATCQQDIPSTLSISRLPVVRRPLPHKTAVNQATRRRASMMLHRSSVTRAP